MHSATLSLLVSIVIATIVGYFTYQNFAQAAQSIQEAQSNAQSIAR